MSGVVATLAAPATFVVGYNIRSERPDSFAKGIFDIHGGMAPEFKLEEALEASCPPGLDGEELCRIQFLDDFESYTIDPDSHHQKKYNEKMKILNTSHQSELEERRIAAELDKSSNKRGVEGKKVANHLTESEKTMKIESKRHQQFLEMEPRERAVEYNKRSSRERQRRGQKSRDF